LVINSICAYLGINCLTIPTDKQAANKEKANASNGSAKAGNGHGAEKRLD
jgi:ethanolaminephosphotransferase